jgi:AcrR family transcriptional regulator
VPRGAHSRPRPSELRRHVDPATRRNARAAPTDDETGKSTRERILDIALDLFVSKGFDKTSLREIAEQLGFSKAALYYHYASKDDILLALHQRLHHLAQDEFGDLKGPATLESWTQLLDRLIDKISSNRKLIALHERNRAAFEGLHHEGHEREHDDLEGRLRSALLESSIPRRQRVRMAVAFAGMLGGLMFTGDIFDDLSGEELADELRRSVRRILDPEP